MVYKRAERGIGPRSGLTLQNCPRAEVERSSLKLSETGGLTKATLSLSFADDELGTAMQRTGVTNETKTALEPNPQR
jgi:hypothetical protein